MKQIGRLTWPATSIVLMSALTTLLGGHMTAPHSLRSWIAGADFAPSNVQAAPNLLFIGSMLLLCKMAAAHLYLKHRTQQGSV